MTLHAYKEDKGGERSLFVGLEFESLECLQPAFDAFGRLTGVQISEYDDVRLSSRHAALLAEQIEVHAAQAMVQDTDIRQFHAALKAVSRESGCVFLEGE